MQAICRNKACGSIYNAYFLTIWNFLNIKQKRRACSLQIPRLSPLSTSSHYQSLIKQQEFLILQKLYMVYITYGPCNMVIYYIWSILRCMFSVRPSSLLAQSTGEVQLPLGLQNLFVSGPLESLIILKPYIKTHIELFISVLYILLSFLPSRIYTLSTRIT